MTGLRAYPLIFIRFMASLFFCFSVFAISYPASAQTQAEEDIFDCFDTPSYHHSFWINTDFSRCIIALSEVQSGGPGKDGIPAIDLPLYLSVDAETALADEEPVISLTLNGEARAWPLRILLWHEIVNDVLGGVPIAVTYCPLCNSAIVFERYVAGQILDFGTTGNLRRSDLVMYDRQTESWWQQYTGNAIVGTFTGERLRMLPARLESWGDFARRNPEATVLQPPKPINRLYGQNPYVGYDSSAFPFLFDGDVPENIRPLARVLVVDGQAWSLDYIRQQTERIIETNTGEIKISWHPGQLSALDNSVITESHDVGTVLVQKQNAEGQFEDIVHHLTFAFVFHAFHPDVPIITR